MEEERSTMPGDSKNADVVNQMPRSKDKALLKTMPPTLEVFNRNAATEPGIRNNNNVRKATS